MVEAFGGGLFWREVLVVLDASTGMLTRDDGPPRPVFSTSPFSALGVQSRRWPWARCFVGDGCLLCDGMRPNTANSCALRCLPPSCVRNDARCVAPDTR